MSGAKRAFTIVEILIAGTLSLGLLALIFQVIVPVMRASGRTANRVELQSLAAVALQTIVKDLTHTGSAAFSGPYYEKDGSVKFAVHPNAGFDSDGEPVWADHVVVYQWTSIGKKLTRTSWPGSPDPSKVSPLKITRLDSDGMQTALRDGATRTVAGYVASFEVKGGGEVGLRLPVGIVMRLEKQTDSDTVETFELNRKVLLRN